MCTFLSISYCSKVRTKKGSGQGWLVETREILFLFSINLNRCALCASSVHQLSRPSQRSLSAFVSLVTDHAPESPLRLSPNSRSTVAFIRSPRQLLQSDTGVPHFALDPLTYRRLLSLSPAADFAEPRPPRHSYLIRVLLFTYFKLYCVCCMYSMAHIMDTFIYYFILFCSIIQSMFQELNTKVIQNKLLLRNYVLSSTDKHVKVCRP